MDSAIQKALEKEWEARQQSLLNDRIALEEGVKKELVTALKLKQQELKTEAKNSRADKPLGQRLAEAIGLRMPDNYYKQWQVKESLKALTHENSEKIDPQHMSLTTRQKNERRELVDGIKDGFGVDGVRKNDWVAEQARERASSTGLKAADVAGDSTTPKESQETSMARAVRVQEYVEALSDPSRHLSNNAAAIAEKETSRRNIEKDMGNSGVNPSAKQAEHTQPTVTPVQVEPEQVRAIVAITARSEIYKEAVAEVGAVDAAQQLSRDDAKNWLNADAKDLGSLSSAELLEDASAVIAENLDMAPGYQSSYAESYLPKAQAKALHVAADQAISEIRAQTDADHALKDSRVPAVTLDRTSNSDEQKFEAWQGVMGSLESEKPRMAALTESQRRAEYEASQIGVERFQAVRAEHDQVNGLGSVKQAPPEKGSLSHWANELTEAANKTRRPLSGSEFKQVVNMIENCSRGADIEKAKAREVAGLLAKVHGPSGESLFRDPELRNAYKAAISPDPIKPQQSSPESQSAQSTVEAKNNRTATPMRMR